MEKSISDVFSLYKLDWDTEYFGVNSAKAIIKEPLTFSQWNELKLLFAGYQFVSIENRNSDPVNSQLIGKDKKAFLADVNIQFCKNISSEKKIFSDITIHEELKRNDQILNLANFKYSKFVEDSELLKRGGAKVYFEWLMNSFEKKGKYFSLSKDNMGNIDGFLLHSVSDDSCIIDLIAVSQNVRSSGIGTALFKSVEQEGFRKGFSTINVGTQLRNLSAINFYQKMGCKQVGCHQVYHLWDL